MHYFIFNEKTKEIIGRTFDVLIVVGVIIFLYYTIASITNAQVKDNVSSTPSLIEEYVIPRIRILEITDDSIVIDALNELEKIQEVTKFDLQDKNILASKYAMLYDTCKNR